MDGCGRRGSRHALVRALTLGLALPALLLGCQEQSDRPIAPTTGVTSTPTAVPTPAPTVIVTLPPVPHGIHLSFVQQRIDEGSRRSQVRVVNGNDKTLRVRSVGLAWPGFPGPRQEARYRIFAKQTIDLRYLLPRADCDQAAPQVPVRAVVETSEGVVERPVMEDGVRFVLRLWDAACAGRRLDAAASFTFDGPWTRTLRDGRPVLRTHLVLTRPGTQRGETEVEVVRLEGSVLFDLSLGGGSSRAVLRPGRPRTRIPVIVRDGGRCDPHSLGQSTQTFLFRASVRLDGGPELSRPVIPSRPQQRRLAAFLRGVCQGLS